MSQKSDTGSQRNFAIFFMFGLIERAGLVFICFCIESVGKVTCLDYIKKTGLRFREREFNLSGPAKALTQNCFLCAADTVQRGLHGRPYSPQAY